MGIGLPSPDPLSVIVKEEEDYQDWLKLVKTNPQSLVSPQLAPLLHNEEGWGAVRQATVISP